MNALLVDDERLARSELRRLLAAHPDVTIVGEARHADEAEAHLGGLDVDLLFLDIRMPGASGFDLLERLERAPSVIFTTAYDEYAVRAFDLNAFDYLLKPIRPERLAAALDKTRRGWRAVGRWPPAFERVFVRDGDRCWLVDLADVVLLEAEGNYTRLNFGSNRPLIARSLQSLEARLDPAIFFRSSRSHIINLKAVESVETAINGSYVLVLSGGRRLAVSRRQSRRLRDTLSL